MFVEQRTYTLQSGKVPEYLKLYSEEGLDVQRRILGRMVGYYSSEIGPLNQIVHMWAYDSLNQRQTRRASLAADPDWQAYLAKILPLIVDMETRILVPAPFAAHLVPGGGDRADSI